MLYFSKLYLLKATFFFPHTLKLPLRYKIPSSPTMVLGSTQILTEMITRNPPGSKGRLCAKNLIATCKPTA
jgi:hypothetical protein